MSASGRPPRLLAGLVGIIVTLTLGAGVGAAADVAMPGTPTAELPAGAPPADAATGAAAPAPAAAAPATPSPAFALGQRSLRLGMYGGDVKDLQRELRRRGQRVTLDGSYGPATRAAVRALQRRFHLKVTGVVDRALLRKLGVQVRSVASGPAAAAAPVASAAAPAQVPTSNGAVGRYLRAFPVAGTHTYEDDFGEPRGQGPHEGNDILSPRGTPVVAVADGSIDRLTRTESGLGGIWIWFRDTAGNTYYYAHLTDIVPGLEAGTHVGVGQQLGTVGNTGDARFGATHLHFELHPGGGPAVSPYSELLAVDPTPPTAAR